MYDFNDAGEQKVFGDLIPDGTFARLRLTIKPGGQSVPNSPAIDQGLFTKSKSSDAIMMDTEMTIVSGKFAKRKLWQMLTVAGGQKDDKGVSKGWNITKSTIRAIIDSRLGLKQSDMSDEAQAKRRFEGLKQLDGIEFAAKICVEPSSNPQYSDQNRIERVLVPGDAHYEAVMSGQDVPAEPTGKKARPAANASAGAGGSGGPAWMNGGGSAANGAAQATVAAAATATKAANGPAWLNN